MHRIEATFYRLKSERKMGLTIFLTAGYPDLNSTSQLVDAAIDGGVDIVEIGMPFSDPLADGKTIQRSSQASLDNGTNLTDCFDICARVRRCHSDVPLIMMGYYNPVLAYGLERFAEDGKRSGLDGVIVADLPPEEAGPLRDACEANDIDIIFLLAPTSTDKRITTVCEASTRLIYCVSLTGVTGARKLLDDDVAALIRRVKSKTSLPLLVGFGISTRTQIQELGAHADSVVVGSALISIIEKSDPNHRAQQVRKFVEELVG